MQRVLVTGANGFIGRRLCRRLLDLGYFVRGSIRRASAAQELPRGAEPLVIGPLEEFNTWPEVLVGIDAVVHLAARTHCTDGQDPNSLCRYRAINVEATRRLVEGCRQTASVRRFVYMSSIKAVGEGHHQPYQETDACEPQDNYGVTKREAEQLVLDLSRGTYLQPVILRPPLVYGSDVKGNFWRLAQMARSRLPLPLASVNNQRSLIFVDNLVDAVLHALEHENAAGEVFHVADGAPLSTRELIDHLARLQGRRPRLWPLPVFCLRALATLLGRQADVSRLTGSLTVATAKIRYLLGWRPLYSTEEGLGAALRIPLHARPESRPEQTTGNGQLVA